MTKRDFLYWDDVNLMLQGVTEGTAIKTKAKKFLENECIAFSKQDNCYVCLPIEGYNITTYKLKEITNGWSCTCQFYNKIVKENLGITCSHVLALRMQLALWGNNKGKFKSI